MNFQKNNVKPGEPVTADGWNAIVDNLFEAQTILSTAQRRVRVQVARPTPTYDLARVRVIALSNGTPFAEAIAPLAPDGEHTFSRLTEGAYQLQAVAPGFAVATATVTVAHDADPAPVPMALAANATPMPNLLGLALPAAVTALGALRPTILDVNGASLPMTGFDHKYDSAPVLAQWPEPGELAPPSGGLVVVAVAQPELVPMPELRGRTITEATDLLTQLGLHIHIIN
jgi:hypothetical protein